jgi:hypoxanthine phosphoribosyltransferase
MIVKNFIMITKIIQILKILILDEIPDSSICFHAKTPVIKKKKRKEKEKKKRREKEKTNRGW